MKQIVVSTMDGGLNQHPDAEINIDPIENALVIHTSGGIMRYYWPNVVYIMEIDDEDD